jgi:hypothetical protein
VYACVKISSASILTYKNSDPVLSCNLKLRKTKHHFLNTAAAAVHGIFLMSNLLGFNKQENAPSLTFKAHCAWVNLEKREFFVSRKFVSFGYSLVAAEIQRCIIDDPAIAHRTCRRPSDG